VVGLTLLGYSKSQCQGITNKIKHKMYILCQEVAGTVFSIQELSGVLGDLLTKVAKSSEFKTWVHAISSNLLHSMG
jgi:hypothetical protein